MFFMLFENLGGLPPCSYAPGSVYQSTKNIGIETNIGMSFSVMPIYQHFRYFGILFTHHVLATVVWRNHQFLYYSNAK